MYTQQYTRTFQFKAGNTKLSNGRVTFWENSARQVKTEMEDRRVIRERKRVKEREKGREID